jgi:hypothetical protein
LRQVRALLEREGIRHAPFFEPDRGNELTAIATEPVFGRRRAPFRRFRLLTNPAPQPAPSTSMADGDSARTPIPHLPGASDMSTVSTTPFRTSFGLFVPCDRETYRKLKRIRHLAAFAEAERRRWDKSQRRLPQNRTFKRRRSSGKVVREMVDVARMVFAPFYNLPPTDPSLGLPADARVCRETELFARFFDDYRQARHPQADASAVGPMNLKAAEIDALLEQVELWNLRR